MGQMERWDLEGKDINTGNRQRVILLIDQGVGMSCKCLSGLKSWDLCSEY